MKDFFKDNRPHNGYSYSEFLHISENRLKETDLGNLNESELQLFNYAKLNFQRMTRINKTFTVSEELSEKLKSVKTPQIWMMITEDWCGDAAQSLPILNKFTEINSLIDLRIIERDKNLDIMDNYLTNGTSRSIPKVISFDDTGEELFIWGPRPSEADLLVKQLKQAGLVKEEINEKLHLWYARNKGKAIEQEFFELLK